MKKPRDKYRVNKQFIISPEFVESRGAQKNLSKLVKLFRTKFQLYARMKRASKRETLQKLAEEVRLNEYKIQKAFNFEPNDAFFRFWEMPKCTCPKLDNIDRYGTNHYIQSETCPVHSIVDVK